MTNIKHPSAPDYSAPASTSDMVVVDGHVLLGNVMVGRAEADDLRIRGRAHMRNAESANLRAVGAPDLVSRRRLTESEHESRWWAQTLRMAADAILVGALVEAADVVLESWGSPAAAVETATETAGGEA